MTRKELIARLLELGTDDTEVVVNCEISSWYSAHVLDEVVFKSGRIVIDSDTWEDIDLTEDEGE